MGSEQDILDAAARAAIHDDHLIITSRVMNEWRPRCLCGWRKTAQSLKAACRAISAHKTEQRAALAAVRGAGGEDAG